MPEQINQSWRDWPRGILVLSRLILRELGHAPPQPIATLDRLKMIPDRSLPLTAPVVVRWDQHQIPFVEARDDRDLAVALGAVHAHLRLGQMEMMRRIALGRVSEMVGPLGIDIDRAVRLLELGSAVPEMIACLPQETKDWTEGFLDGINHHLKHAAVLPREFELLALRREPWTLVELMTLMRLSAIDISWLIWSRLLRARDRMTAETWSSLWPRLLQGGAPPGLGGAADNSTAWPFAAMGCRGSNSAAISGECTGTGAALIASDPHLPYGLPNPWLIVGMRSPGYHCVSLMMPALPFMALGRNPRAAWGGTNLHAQSSDLFDISSLSERDIEERFETIQVRGAADRRIRLRRTMYGPVVSDGVLLRSRRRLALRWVGHRASDELSAMLAVARCRDWAGYQTALAGFGVSGLNMIFAGCDGSVGHLLAAHLPKRPGTPPRDLHLPLSSAAAWDSLVNSSYLPMHASPEHPIVVSANQRIENCPVPVGLFFSPPDRSQRIMELARSAQQAGVETVSAIQADVLSRGSLMLRDFLLSKVIAKIRPQHQVRFLTALTKWDGTYDTNSSGALSFELLLGGVARILGRLQRSRLYDTVWMTQDLLLEDFRSAPDAHLRRAVARALVPAARRFERYQTWGNFHRIALKHPFGRLPLIGRRYRIRDFAAPGSNNTVQKAAHPIGTAPHAASFGACARHISDLSDPDANWMVLLGGQDGWFGSENFNDLTPLWRRGEYVKLPLQPEAARAYYTEVVTLRPERLTRSKVRC